MSATKFDGFRVEAEPNASGEYALVAAVPLSTYDELESFHDAVLVTVAWGTNTLLAEQVDAGQSLVLGDENSDFVLPDNLGMTRWPVIVARSGQMVCVVPPNATGLVELDGRTLAIEAAKLERLLVASNESAGAFEVALRKGANLRMDLAGGFSVTVRTERAAKKSAPLSRAAMFAALADKYVALSLVAHLGILGVVGGIMPHMNSDDSEAISRDDMLSMQHMLAGSAEAEKDRVEAEGANAGAEPQNAEAGGAGQKARDDEGKMGAPNAPSQNAQYAILKRNDGPKQMSREEVAMAQSFGMVALIGTVSARSGITAPGAVWGSDPNGDDDKDAMGNKFGPSKDIALGASGLSLSGTGLSGGGPWDGIALDKVGDLGTCIGDAPCAQRGGDRRVYQQRMTHKPQSPVIHWDIIERIGHLPADAIQRVVRGNAGRFRSCYEIGLRENPSLRGRVATKFVIARDGAVSMSADAGSDMPNAAVTACVVRAFQGLSFPMPESGTVNVTYPIMFSPGE